jgi:cytochrome c oxidase cbb3-type subunit 4
MEMETIRTLQAYGYVIGVTVCTLVFYSYIYYIYNNEKKGVKNYENYSNIALDDELDSTPLETSSPWERAKEEK